LVHKVKSSGRRHLPKGVIILHEDRDVLVVEKPAGLLTISTDKSETNTLYYRLTDYVRKGNYKSFSRVFIVHRLDQDVSGILIFTKNIEAKWFLQEQWEKTDKKYHAVVHGKMEKKAGTITSYLMENSCFVVHSTTDKRKGKLSHTAYKVLEETRTFSLLEITLLTGRKNQIRVHLADAGHPIVGDRKYGRGDKEHKRIALHATSISFTHPFNKTRITITSELPAFFHRLLGHSTVQVAADPHGHVPSGGGEGGTRSVPLISSKAASIIKE